MEKGKKYIRRRSGSLLNVDTGNIRSDCHQITFSNTGDVDFTVGVVDTLIQHKLGPYMELTLGDETRSDIQESNFYSLTFDPAGVGNKICSIERMLIVEESC